MIYYQYNQNAVITNKSLEPFSTRCAHSDLEFDLELYEITITRMREDGWVLKWSMKEKPIQDLADTIRSMKTINNDLQSAMSDQKTKTELLEDCIVQLTSQVYQ